MRLAAERPEGLRLGVLQVERLVDLLLRVRSMRPWSAPLAQLKALLRPVRVALRLLVVAQRWRVLRVLPRLRPALAVWMLRCWVPRVRLKGLQRVELPERPVVSRKV